MTAEAMQNLIGEFGESIGIPDLQLDEDNRCNLMFDDIAVSFEWNHDNDSVYVYSYLGDSPEENPEKFYVRLLDANYIFRHTQGATLGVEDSSGKVVLIREHRLETMQLPEFESIVEKFVNLAEYWKQRLPTLGRERENPADDEAVGSYAVKV